LTSVVSTVDATSAETTAPVSSDFSAWVATDSSVTVTEEDSVTAWVAGIDVAFSVSFSAHPLRKTNANKQQMTLKIILLFFLICPTQMIRKLYFAKI
jgi:hypothetical protein